MDSKIPSAVGWYAVWLTRADGLIAKLVLFCFPVEAVVVCEYPDENGPKFRPVTDPFFKGARWEGPFDRRDAATAALAGRLSQLGTP